MLSSINKLSNSSKSKVPSRLLSIVNIGFLLSSNILVAKKYVGPSTTTPSPLFRTHLMARSIPCEQPWEIKTLFVFTLKLILLEYHLQSSSLKA